MVGTPEHENMHISITTFRHISTFLTYKCSKNDVNPCLVIFITYKYIIRFHRYVRSNDFWVRVCSSEPDFGSRGEWKYHSKNVEKVSNVHFCELLRVFFYPSDVSWQAESLKGKLGSRGSRVEGA